MLLERLMAVASVLTEDEVLRDQQVWSGHLFSVGELPDDVPPLVERALRLMLIFLQTR